MDFNEKFTYDIFKYGLCHVGDALNHHFVVL